VNKLNVDDIISYKKDDNKAGGNFLEDQKQEIDKDVNTGDKANFIPREDFKDRSGRADIFHKMPYETIDMIFNRTNIYTNMQFHDPEKITYNLYDKSRWRPYITLPNDVIWKGKFDPFYSLSNFGPTYTPGLVNKMKESLIKEMRVGIAAARSGKNLQTRFKKKVN
jgi:hypothetical protein